jgi:MFS family permease
VLGGALWLDALDVSMVGVALPSMRTSLGLSTSSLQWVVSGYVLGYGGLLLLGGRAADLLGRRRVFLTAVAAFAVLSLLGGLTSVPGLLIAARFIKGVAAAFTAPAGMSLLTTTFPEGPMRNRAGAVRPAHRGELAVDAARARARRPPGPGRWLVAHPPRGPGQGRCP